jgi:hypothetical protein
MKEATQSYLNQLEVVYDNHHDYCDFLSGSIVVESDIALYNEEMNKLERLRLEIQLYELTATLCGASQEAQANILEEVESLLYCKELAQ